jgi:hypothetical protein
MERKLAELERGRENVMVPRISLRRFSIMFGAVALVVCLAGLASLSFSRRIASAERADEAIAPVVGVWEVDVVGAPFGPHLFTFHSDHTFLSSNPDAGDTSTSDSDGEGVWDGWNTVKGMFKEYDASRGPTPPAGTFVGILTVTYTIKVKGDSFTGDYTATETSPTGVVEGSGTGTFIAYRLGTAPPGFPPA